MRNGGMSGLEVFLYILIGCIVEVAAVALIFGVFGG
jgi:hypothetical protein